MTQAATELAKAQAADVRGPRIHPPFLIDYLLRTAIPSNPKARAAATRQTAAALSSPLKKAHSAPIRPTAPVTTAPRTATPTSESPTLRFSLKTTPFCAWQIDRPNLGPPRSFAGERWYRYLADGSDSLPRQYAAGEAPGRHTGMAHRPGRADAVGIPAPCSLVLSADCRANLKFALRVREAKASTYALGQALWPR
jgi:hypothetical protein